MKGVKTGGFLIDKYLENRFLIHKNEVMYQRGCCGFFGGGGYFVKKNVFFCQDGFFFEILMIPS